MEEKRDLRKLKDTLPLALRCCELRLKRTGDVLSVGEMARYGLELLYSSELEMLRQNEEKKIFDVEVLPGDL